MKRFAKIILILGVFSTGMSALADEVCVGHDANGNCTGYVNPNDGTYTPNVPGVPNNPNDPSKVGSCTCVGYDTNGACTYYVGSDC